jgi:hypothetical protein
METERGKGVTVERQDANNEPMCDMIVTGGLTVDVGA